MYLLLPLGKLAWTLETQTCLAKKRGEEDWPIHYAALLEYYDEHGTCNVPQKCTYECYISDMLGEDGNNYRYKGNLGKWLDNQRQAHKGQGGSKLTTEHEVQLQLLADQGIK